jgi:hypothetical protein
LIILARLDALIARSEEGKLVTQARAGVGR